jgi:two-component system, LytTR family, sensor kinase
VTKRWNITDSRNPLTILTHVLFWVGTWMLLLILFSGFLKTNDAFLRASLVILLLGALFYLNTLVLVDLFLERKRYLLYGAFLVLVTAITLKIKFIVDFNVLAEQAPFFRFGGPVNAHVISAFPVIFCLAFSTLLQLLFNRYKKEKKYLAQINEYSGAQMQFLKSQINPHFLFNNLNNIYSLVITKNEQAPQMILKLSELLRYVVYKNDDQKVSVFEELSQVKNLVGLYQLKEDEKLNVTISEEDLKKPGMIEPMILIPLVENCFKHWDGSFNSEAFIKISIRSDEKCFSFCTENTSQKKNDTADKEDGGIGLENIKKRLALAYGEQASFTVQKSGNKFVTQLIIKWLSK